MVDRDRGRSTIAYNVRRTLETQLTSGRALTMNRRTNAPWVRGIIAGMFLATVVSSAWAVTISGEVRLPDGTAISGVTMKGLPGDPITDDNGFYTATVAVGFSGTVTPTEVNFVFDPESRTYAPLTSDQINQDYTAAQRVLSIFGYVRTADGTGIADVLMSGFPSSVSTNAVGYYQAFVLRDWSGSVTPTKTGYTFDPAGATYASVTANVGPVSYVGTPTPATGGNSGSGGQTSGGSTGGTGSTTGGTSGGTSAGDGGSNGTTDTNTVVPACGAGGCGAGVATTLPLSVLGWCGLKLTVARRRPNRR